MVQSLTSLGLSPNEVVELLTHPALSDQHPGQGKGRRTGVGQGAGGGNVLDGLFDASDRPEGGDIIIWWNDIEKDRRWVLVSLMYFETKVFLRVMD